MLAKPRRMGWIASLRAFAAVGCLFFVPAVSPAQAPDDNWPHEVRRYAAAQDWDHAFQIVSAALARSPTDIEARSWRARLLLWSGQQGTAEREFLALTTAAPNDLDIWQGLASVYARQGRWDDALRTLDRAIQIAPDRADLRVARAQALRALNRLDQARAEFQAALKLNSSSGDARAGLLSLRRPLKHELRFGSDTDLFNYTGAYQGESLILVSRWSPHRNTAVAGNFYQRDGPSAGKFLSSVTRSSHRWGAFTVGGAAAHDGGIIPKNEAFFGLDRGWQIGEGGFVRGVEASYDQHWYWYTTARILTLTGGALLYLPRDWSVSLRVTASRSAFPGLPVEWQPSGATQLNFPVAHRGERHLSADISFAAGTEDFALVDQIGSFSSHTFGGGWRLQLNRRHDVAAYAAYQQRTQGRTQTSFGFSYAIHF
jgi:hypothetical protein